MENQANQPTSSPDDSSLESPSNSESTTVVGSPAPPGNDDDKRLVETTPAPTPLRPKGSLFSRLKNVVSHFNPYLLGFILLLVLVGIGLYVVTTMRSKPQDLTTGGNQKLTDDALKQLNNADVKIGDPKQVLSVESNTIFAGKVLIRDSLDVAGGLKLGGSLSLPGLTVAGVSSLDQIQANGLSISGNAAVQGQLTVQKSLNVSGGGSFGGPITAAQLTVDTLQLTRDLVITHHIDAGGGNPGKSDGAALGGGGTSSVSGSDTAGAVVINTGGGPPAGCFITVNFAQRFGGTPHIALTPANASASTLDYYVNRTSTSFSICTSSAPGAGQNYIFDYIVID